MKLYKNRRKIQNIKGFTIIELMIATTIFAVIMIITTTAIIGISKTYIQGLVESQNQNTTRRVVSQISQDIQFNNQATININGISGLGRTPLSSTGWFCIGQDVYVVQLDQEILNSGDWALIRYSSSSCPGSQPTFTNGLPTNPPYTYNAGSVEELLTTNQQLARFSIIEINGYYKISATVAYGNSSVLQAILPNPNDGVNYECNTSSFSINFCSITSLTNSIEPSINN